MTVLILSIRIFWVHAALRIKSMTEVSHSELYTLHLWVNFSSHDWFTVPQYFDNKKFHARTAVFLHKAIHLISCIQHITQTDSCKTNYYRMTSIIYQLLSWVFPQVLTVTTYSEYSTSFQCWLDHTGVLNLSSSSEELRNELWYVSNWFPVRN